MWPFRPHGRFPLRITVPFPVESVTRYLIVKENLDYVLYVQRPANIINLLGEMDRKEIKNSSILKDSRILNRLDTHFFK